MRVVFFSERLAPPFDEGIKNVAANLLRRLRAGHDVLALTTGGANAPDLGLHELPGLSRLLWDAALRRAVAGHRPQRIIYLPTASMTLAAFVRARVLQSHGRGAPVTLIALQPRRQSAMARLLVPLIAPARVVVQSQASAARLAYLGRRVRLAPVGVDTARFAPVGAERRRELRAQYDLPAEARIVLHAGHINRNRNVQMLAALQTLPGVQTLLAGSRSTPQDATLIEELRAAGVRVIADFVPHVEELYQLADLYVFPCPPDAPAEQTPAIEVPLSVLEALACDLPVATTRFGGLPALFPADAPAIRFVERAGDAEAWRASVLAGLSVGRGQARRLAEPLSWDSLVEAALGGEPAERGP